MKTSLTIVDLYASAREMRNLIGRRVENIYKTPSGYLFKFAGGSYLIIDETRASLTGVLGERDYRGAETLRGLLRDEKLDDVTVPRFDKILVLKFGEVDLIAELLKPFNLIAVKGGKIVWLDHYYRGKDRELKTGVPYSYPPMPYVDPLAQRDAALRALAEGKDLRRALSRELGLGPEVAEEVYQRSSGNADRALAVLEELIREVTLGQLRPTLYVSNGVPVTVTPIRFISINADTTEEFDAFWKALDKYFIEIELRKAIEKKTANITSRRQKLEQTIKSLEVEIEEYRRKGEELRRIAQTMMNIKYELEDLMGRLNTATNVENESIRIIDVDRKRREAVLETSGIKFVVKLDQPVGKQISSMFEEAKEYLRKAEKAEETLRRLRAELERLEEQRVELERSIKEGVVRVAERSWFERYRWTATSRKTPVLGGRDASQNEILVKKYLRDNYLFFHADIPGASVVITRPIEDQLELLEVAQFAASYSKAWKAGIHSIDVFYVFGSQVSKQPPSGEYLARGSFMIYGTRNYIRHVRLELAIGVRRDGDIKRVVVAPEKSIKMLAHRYVVVTPGSSEKGKVAKDIAKRLDAEGLLDDLVMALPGPSSVQEWGSGEPMPWEEIKAMFSTW